MTSNELEACRHIFGNMADNPRPCLTCGMSEDDVMSEKRGELFRKLGDSLNRTAPPELDGAHVYPAPTPRDDYTRTVPMQGNALEKIAQKWAWGLAESANAAIEAKARADGETFLEAIRAIQKQTLEAAYGKPSRI